MDIERVARTLASTAGTPAKAATHLREIFGPAGMGELSPETVVELNRVALRLDEMANTGHVPMADEALASWFRLRGVTERDIPEMVEQYRDRTEDEMDEIYDQMHGSMAG